MNNIKKRVGFVIGSLTAGGAERVVSNLSNELIDKYDIVIIAFVKVPPFYSLNEKIKVIACKETISTPTSIFQSLRLNLELLKGVSKAIKSEKIDIIIGFITSANIVATLAAKLNKIPSIISERNNPMITEVPKFWVLLRNLVYPKADKLILQTEGVKKFYKDRIKSNKIVILPNPISKDLSLLRDDKVKKENIILTVGRLDKNKCHDLIINAFKRVKTNDWKLLIAGVGSKESDLKELIRISHLQDSVELLGKVKDIHKYYNRAGVFVFASRTEGFPNALLEAMHFGIPTISTDCNFGPSEIIENGENGYLIPVGDQEMLEKRLKTLIDDEELRVKFSKNAKLTTERFHSDAVVKKWDEVIDSLIYN
ncbi:glycosyltransferase family 4 protein [Confluentibacter citreus]|uniref:glycosyltransferase family 4 protein n=1 Tax=Confluentibacter citreus TaxID=2007307 RepID=UPI000C286A80|nr:glycosyltransferase family 4 protein [Confluentibacter citreus]